MAQVCGDGARKSPSHASAISAATPFARATERRPLPCATSPAAFLGTPPSPDSHGALPPPTPDSRGASRLSRAALEIDPAANSGMAQVCRDGARKFTALQMMKIRPLRRRLAPSFGSVARAQPSGVLRPRYSTAWDRPRLSRRLPTLARSS